MPDPRNVALLAGDALIYFAVLAALFRARAGLGLAFFCALGVMHLLESYLASMSYVSLPFGVVTSPASTVLFTDLHHHHHHPAVRALAPGSATAPWRGSC